jgi:hypothetical protein
LHCRVVLVGRLAVHDAARTCLRAANR